MRTESGQNGLKRGHIGKNSGPVQIRARRTLLWTRYFTKKYNYGRFCACAMANCGASACKHACQIVSSTFVFFGGFSEQLSVGFAQ